MTATGSVFYVGLPLYSSLTTNHFNLFQIKFTLENSILMKTLFFSVLVLILIQTTFSQSPYLKTSIYFETDEFVLTSEHKQILDNILFESNGKEITKILIRGNTDSDADSLYNIALSDKRTNSVALYLIAGGLKETQMTQDHYGENKPKESNATETGKQINRRFDIVILYKPQTPPVADNVVEVADKLSPQTPTDTCYDTLIYIGDGTIIKMNKCEYLKQKNCLEFTAYDSPERIRDSNMTTLDSVGNALMSGGMFVFKTCNDSCLNEPITVRIPVPCNVILDMDLYAINTDGSWTMTGTEVRVVKVNGTYYYEMELICPGGYNCDKKFCKPGIILKFKKPCRKFKFKATEGLNFNSIQLSINCPFGLYDFELSKNRKKATLWMKCPPGIPSVKIEATTSNGEKLLLDYRSVRLLSDKKRTNKCPNLARKYKIHLSDFDTPGVEENIRM